MNYLMSLSTSSYARRSYARCCTLLPVIAFLVLPLVASAQVPKTVYVTIRVDDMFMRESNIHPQEIDGFVGICEKHGARVMLAVVPHRLEEPLNADGVMARSLRRFVEHGHMVSMHGFDHRCSLCGSTGHEFDCATKGVLVPTQQQHAQLTRGKELLEKATGKRVSTYVSPGSDDQLNPQTKAILQTLGFRWVTDTLVSVPTSRDDLSRVPDVSEYTWDLGDSTYGERLSKAKEGFVEAVKRGNYFGIALHDHFTRRAFRSGIVLRWTDEFLTYVKSLPGIRIRFVAIDDIDPAWFAPPLW